MTGKVYLVGAGPGDPDLITRKGLRLIQQADVIIYDRLIPMELLNDARDDAELINAGKAPTKHRLSQDAINDLLVDYALAGRTVVRLKGGDPFVFGRGSEEAIVCAEAGIPFEVVPGVSSAFAVPAYAGIPLTHRHISRSFTIMTGHDDPDNPEVAAQWQAVIQTGGTLVILMGVRQLSSISQRLIDAGLDPNMPAAVIESGTMAAQRVIEGTVQTLPDLAQSADVQPPAITVIGEVVRLRQMGVQWFDRELTLLSV